MEQNALLKSGGQSPYSGDCFLLMTKHAKSAAMAPPIWETLGASVLEYGVDTDALGTFTGEIERKGSALDCARRKCALGLERLPAAEFGLASEGSFGPHPYIPFLPGSVEILYLMDRRHGFDLHVTHVSEKTNYRMDKVGSLDELNEFAKMAQFPSHALIVRPHVWEDKTIIFKGIESLDDLEGAFRESRKHSDDGLAWVETDMRAHMNPTRMSVIAEVAEHMAQRLASLCPKCNTPGWGKCRFEQGLRCGDCGTRTDLVKAEIFGCSKCDHEEVRPRSDALIAADPGHCPNCNP